MLLIVGLALGSAACGQGLQLWPGAAATPGPYTPPAERRIDLVAEPARSSTLLFAALVDVQQQILPNTLQHAQRTINATGFAWPFFAADADALVVYEDVDGDGLCDATCGDRAWQVKLGAKPVQHYALATLAAAPADLCPVFASVPWTSEYTLQLTADPNAPEARERLSVKVTTQNDDTTSQTASSSVLPSGGVWRIALPTSSSTVGTTVNATGSTLQLALPLGQVFGDQAVAVTR